MGISFGSASKKPYVGSKEVKEAYVGSELVYRATPPYFYYFLGKESTYYISNECELTSRTSIEKYQGVYRIVKSTGTGGITLKNLTPHWNKKLKFLILSESLNNITLTWQFGSGSQQYESFNTTSNEYLAEVTVRNGASSVYISCPRPVIYLDAIRVEEA